MIAAAGIYCDLPDDEYRRIEAVSHSDLKGWASGDPLPPKGRHLFLRQALHAALLQPEYAKSAFVTMSDNVDLRTKEGQAALAEYEERTGKRALQPKERESIKQMVLSLRQDPETRKILEAPGECELAVVSDLGVAPSVLSKGLIDKKCRACIVDIKGTGYFNEAEFIDQFYKYGYDSQGAHYVDLVHAHTGEYLPFFFVCVSERSLQVWIQRLTPEQYVTGRRWYRDMLRLYSLHGTLQAQLSASVEAE